MTYKEAIQEILITTIEIQGLSPAGVSEMAGYANNFLSRFFAGRKRDIGFDALSEIAQVLGMSLSELIDLAEQYQHEEGVKRRAFRYLQESPGRLEQMSTEQSRSEEERTFLRSMAVFVQEFVNPEHVTKEDAKAFLLKNHYPLPKIHTDVVTRQQSDEA